MSAVNLHNKIDNNNGTPSDNSNNNVENNKSTDVPKDEISDVSPSSGVSSASSKSTVSKQSGIRPPSRIGRPCGGIQKPAIPTTPTKNSSDDSIRRLTDDYGRHRLTDLLEADESEEDGLDCLRSSSRRKRYSSIGSTASSMDGLWDLHPRRLSEAGLSRHSDSSAVLTEDTDSFIIGQRVWVGGTKPGTIAYIGETQFAPGEWAGIALDEPIGKNDGSVAGTRYFQCENKKGVFSRLTRLTRVPLEQPGMGSSETFTSPNNGVRRSPISPTGSTKSLLKSPTLSTSNTSLTSSAHVDFKIGDRVIIKSTQGSKVGTVRYMGLTDFAPGEWVGVELDDPRGKNDGSVEGKRYFECRQHFGLFAPISKVSKSPSKHKPGACVVHSGGPGLPPSGLKRVNSKESMTSLASKTSAASSVRRVRLGVTSLAPKKVPPKSSTPIPTRTALQDVLREKQQHIEQLLKERDLERAEITRAASQADDAEQRLFTLKQEFEQYRSQCELKALESAELLSQLNINREELLTQLEDEKRKNEDLQFRFEEAAITKSDIEENILAQSVTNENYVRKIRDLEQSLADERLKSETLEGISNKLFEAEESLIKAREEVDSLTSELEETRKKRLALEEEKTVSAELVDSLRKQIDGVTVENEEKGNTINKLNDNISKLSSEYELLKRKAEEIRTESDDNCEKKSVEVEALKLKLAHSDEFLKEKLKVLEKLEKTNEQLIKENDKLKMEISAKSLDLENALDKLVHKEEECKSTLHNKDIETSELNQKINELERHRENLREVEISLRKELDETRENLKTKISEVEDVKKELNVHVVQGGLKLEEANKTITHNNEEIKKLNEELALATSKFEENKNEIHSRHARQVADQDSQLMALSAEIQQKNEEVTKLSIVISKLEEDLCSKNNIIEKLHLQLNSLQNEHSKNTEASILLNEKLHASELDHGDVQRQLRVAHERITTLTEINQRLENEIKTLMININSENAAQLEHLRNELQVREQSIETIKVNFSEKMQNSERIRHEIELKYQHLVAEFEKMKIEFQEKLHVSTQSEALLRERCDSSLSEMTKIRDEHRIKVSELEHSLHEKEIALVSLQGRCSENEKYYQEQLKAATEKLDHNLLISQAKITALTDESLKLKEQLAKKSEEIIEANAKSSHILAHQQQTENELKQKYSEDIKKLEFEISEKTMYLEKTKTEIQLLKTDCQNSNNNLTAKDHRISELVAEGQRAKDLINQLQEELTATQLVHQQSAKEREEVQNQCRGLLEQVAVLTEKVRTGETLFQNLEIENKNYINLMNRLKITEQQKQQCLRQLEIEISAGGEFKNCSEIGDLLNQVKIDTNDQNEEKILDLQKIIEMQKNQLAECNHQFEVQKIEILRLQEELLAAREANVKYSGGPQDQNSVSLNNTHNTTHKTQHESFSLNPLELQVQLVMLKNSFTQFSKRFETLQKENNYLLARLRNALNNGNVIAVNNVIQRFAQFKQQFSVIKNALQRDNYNLQKTVQYSMLQLQQKQIILNEKLIQIKNLQQIVRNLPMQCKQFAVPKEHDLQFDECVNLDVDNKKIHDLLISKEERIQQLQKQLSTLLIEYSNWKSETPLCMPKPSICAKIQPSVKKLSVITPSPPKIVRVFVPVPQPQVIIKKILVPQINGKRCPPPRIQRVEIPKTYIQKVPFTVEVPSQCSLPDLTSLYDCALPEQSIATLDLRGYSSAETFKFKQNLLSLIKRQRNCGVTSNSEASCLQLPKFVVPQSCLPPTQIVEKLVISGYSSLAVESYKQSLLQLLNKIQQCDFSTRNSGNTSPFKLNWPPKEEVKQTTPFSRPTCPDLPSFEISQPCVPPSQVVENLVVDGYNSSTVELYKQSLLQFLHSMLNCQCLSQNGNQNKQQSLIANNLRLNIHTCKNLPRLPSVHSCVSPISIINMLSLKGYSEWQADIFKHELLTLLVSQQRCCSSKTTSSFNIRVPVGIPKIVKYPVEFPKIIIKNRKIPVKVPVAVPVPQRPKILMRQIPAYICRKPNAIITEVSGHALKKVSKNIMKQVLGQTPPRIIIKEVPVKIFVPVKVPYEVKVPVRVSVYKRLIVKVPVKVPVPFKVKVPVFQPPKTIIQKVPVNVLKENPCPLSQVPKIIIKNIPVVVPQKPKIIIKEIPVHSTSDCKPFIQQVPVPIKINVPVKVASISNRLNSRLSNLNVLNKCASNLNGVTKILHIPVTIIKQVPVYVPQKPQVIIKQIPITTTKDCKPVIQQVPIRINVPLTKSVPVQIPMPVKVPVDFNNKIKSSSSVSCSKSTVFVRVHQPPKILLKQVPIYIPQQPKVVVKQVPVYMTPQDKFKPLVREKLLPILLPPRIIIQQVPVKVPVKIPVSGPCNISALTKVPTKVSVEVPRTTVKEVFAKASVPLFNKVLIKEIPIPVPQKPRIIVQQVPVFVKNQKKPIIIVKEKPITVQLPPRTVIQQVPVKVLVPVRIPVKILIPVSVPLRSEEVPIPSIPRTIIKEVPVRVNVPMKVPVPVLIKEPVKIPKPVKVYVQVPVPVKVIVPVKSKCHFPEINVNGGVGVQNQIKNIVLPSYISEEVQQRSSALVANQIQQFESYSRIPQLQQTKIRCPYKIMKIPVEKPVYFRYPVKVPVLIKYPVEVPKIVEKVVKVTVKVPVEVPVPQPSRIVVKDVPIYVKQKPEIIIKEKGVLIPSTPRTIIKEVPVRVNVPMKVPVPVLIKEPVKIPKPIKIYVQVPVPVKKMVPVPVPTKQIVEVPKEIIKEVKVPVRVPVPVRISEPPKVIVKQVPVLVYQRPKIIVKQVPVMVTNNQKSKIIIREKEVPIPSTPRTIIKEIPVRVNVPMKVPVPVLIKEPVKISKPVKIYVQVPVPVPTKQIVEVPKEIIKEVKVPVRVLVPVRISEPPKVIIKQVPIKVPVPVLTKELVKISKPVKVYVQVPVPVKVTVPVPTKRVVEVPMEIIKEVKVPIRVPVPVRISESPKVIVKQVPILVYRRPKILVKQIPVMVADNQKPTIIIKEKGVPIPSTPRTIIKEIPVRSNVPMKVSVPVLIKEIVKIPKPVKVYVQVPVPIKVTVPVPVPTKQVVEVPKVIIKEVKVPVRVPVPVRISEPPKVIVKQVPMKVPVPVMIKERVKIPKPIKVYVQVPVPVKVTVPVPVPTKQLVEVPKEIIKEVKVPFRVPVPVRISEPPKVIVKQVPVLVYQRPKIIVKQVPVMVTNNQKPKIIIREKEVAIPSMPRTIIKEIPVRVNVPMKVPVPVLIKEPVKILTPVKVYVQVPVPVKVAVPVPVPTKQIVAVPKEIIKEVKVLVGVPEPPKVIIKQVPVKVPVPVLTKEFVKILKPVKVYVQVPVPVKVTVPVPVSKKQVVEVPKVIIREHKERVRVPVPVRISEPPKVIVKQVPIKVPVLTKELVKIPKPVKVYVQVPVPVKVTVPVPVPTKQIVEVPKEIIKEVKVPIRVPVPIHISEPPKLIVKQVPVLVYQRPKIVVKQVPVIVTNNQKPKIIIREKEVPIPSTPRTIIKEVPVRVNVPMKVPVPVLIKEPVKILTPVKVYVQVPVPVKVPVPVPTKQIVAVPKEIIKEVKVPVRFPVPVHISQPRKVIVKQVAIKVPVPVLIKEPINIPKPVKVYVQIPVPVKVTVPVPVPIKQVVEVPKEIIKEVKVPVRVPVHILESPKVIVKQVPVLVYQRPKIVVKQVPVMVTDNQRPKIIIKEKGIPIPSTPRTIIKEVPVRVNVPMKVPIPVFIKQLVKIPKPVKVYIEVPVKVAVPVPVLTKQLVEVPKEIIKEVKVPVRVPVPVRISEPPNIIVKQVAIKVPVPVLIKEPIKIPKPVKVQVPVPVKVTVPVRVPIKQVVEVPKEIIKEVKVPFRVPVPVRISEPPKVIVKQVPIKVPVPVLIKEPVKIPKRVKVYVQVPVPTKQLVEVPKEIIKEVKVPVRVPVPVHISEPPKVILKQVPVIVYQRPKIVVKQVPVVVTDNQKPKIIIKEKEVPIHLRPRTIIKEVPVRVNVPMKVPVPVLIKEPIKIYVQVPVPIKVTFPVKSKCKCNGGVGVRNQIKNIAVPSYNSEEVLKLKQNRFSNLMQQRSSALVANQIQQFESDSRIPQLEQTKTRCPYKIMKIPVEKPIYFRYPVKVPVLIKYPMEVPKIVEKVVKVPVEVPLPQRPKIVVKEVPVYIKQKPKVVIKQIPAVKEVPVPVQSSPRVVMKQVPVTLSRLIKIPVIVKVPVKIPVEIPKIVRKEVIKKIPIYVQVSCSDKSASDSSPIQHTILEKPIYIRQPPKIIYQNVPKDICLKPHYIIKQVPIEKKVPVIIKQPIYLPCKEAPQPLNKVNELKALSLSTVISLNNQKLKHVPNDHKSSHYQLCKPVIKEIPVPVKEPTKIITKQVPLYIKVTVPVRVPQIVEKIVPKKIIQQVPIPQPPRIVETQVPVPVQMPPKIFIRKVAVPVLNGTVCPTPRVLIKKIPVPQPPRIFTKPVLIHDKTPPKVLIKQTLVPYTSECRVNTNGKNDLSCNLPTLPMPGVCISPDKYVQQLVLQSFPAANTIFRNNLLQILKQQFVCGQSNQNMDAIVRSKNSLSKKLCVYRKIIQRLKQKLNTFPHSGKSLDSLKLHRQPSQLPVVPIPMMHVMKSATPSIPLKPFQHVMSPLSISNTEFIYSLRQAYKSIQEALTHCMDAILAQTLAQSQIINKCNNCHQLIQDKELAENQIRFLNSIIVDIQKKNEEQKARIEILESGYSPAMANELKLIGLPQHRQLPPRVYCDICEEFDLHETEDCPKQNTDLAPSHSSRGHKPHQERPYCEICEVFGHSTEECPEDQTF